MTDFTKAYLEKRGIPVTRENYLAMEYMGDVDPNKPLDAELEAALPKEIQWKRKSENQTE